MFIGPDNPLAAEILQEAGAAYFAGCKKMVASLEALSAFDRAVGSSAQDDGQARSRTQLSVFASWPFLAKCEQPTPVTD